ncbi:MAG: glycosyltransferase [Fibrobacterota bacterium]
MNLLHVFRQSEKDGISDYAWRLGMALSSFFNVVSISPDEFRTKSRLLSDIILVQYEDSHFTGPDGRNFYGEAVAGINTPLCALVHEAYAVNPYIRRRPDPGGFLNPLAFLRRIKFDFDHPGERLHDRLYARNMSARLILVHSESEKAALVKRGASADKIESIAFPVPDYSLPATLRRDEFVPEGSFIIATAGFFSPSVDYSLVIECLRRMPELYWIHIGGERTDSDSSIRKKIEAEISSSGLSDRMSITGFLPNDKFGAYIELADVLIFPFKFKAASASLPLAASFRKPALVSDIAFCREAASLYRNLKIFQEGSPDALVDRVRELMNNPGEIEALSKNAERASEKFSFDNSARSIHDLWRKHGLA